MDRPTETDRQMTKYLCLCRKLSVKLLCSRQTCVVLLVHPVWCLIFILVHFVTCTFIAQSLKCAQQENVKAWLSERGLKIHTLYIDTAASRSGVVWRFSFLIRLTLTVAKTLNIPSCQFFSLFTVFTFSSILFMYRRRKCDWAPVFVFCALQVSASSSWCCWKWVWFWEWRFTSTWSLSS